MLELIVNFNEFHETRQYGFVHGGPDRLRAIYNRNVDTGDYSIRDGKVTGNGNPSEWQYRCGGNIAAIEGAPTKTKQAKTQKAAAEGSAAAFQSNT